MSDKKANGSDPLSTPDPGPEDILSKSQARRVEVQKAAEQGKISVPVKVTHEEAAKLAGLPEPTASQPPAFVAEALTDPPGPTSSAPGAGQSGSPQPESTAPVTEKKEGAWKRLTRWLAGQQGPSI